jgi:thioredoxin 1
MNKKKYFPLLFVIFAVFFFAFVPAEKQGCNRQVANNTSDAGIQFIEANWNKAVAEAKKQKKMIFIDAYTSWCGPCRMLKQNTFTDKAAGEYFNKHFINIALDMEKGDGIAFAQKYQVAAYPTLFIMDADQKSVTTSEGYINAGQLIEFGKYVINKLPKIN